MEDTNDPSTAICKVVGCKKPKVSRGKLGSSRFNLTNTSMTAHLASHHPSKSKEFLESKENVATEKRKREDNSEDTELELSTVPIFNIRGQAERSSSTRLPLAAGLVVEVHPLASHPAQLMTFMTQGPRRGTRVSS